MQIETIKEKGKIIIQVRIEDEVREDMQKKIKQIYVYDFKKYPTEDFSSYYPFKMNQLKDWKTVLDWKAISSNKLIEWSPNLIRRFYDKWDWLSLWMNKSVLCWDAELLEEFEDRIKWDVIVWSSVDWSKELHKKFEKYLTWGSFKYDYEMVKQHTSHNRTMAYKTSSNNPSEQFMELYYHAKSINEELGVYILYNAVEKYFNKKLENNSYPL